MQHNTGYLTLFQHRMLKFLSLPILFIVGFVIYGCITDNLDLLSFNLDAPAIEPITGLCFLLVFFAFYTLLIGNKKFSLIFSLILIAIAFISICENFYNIKTQIHFPFTYLTNLSFSPLAYECSISFLIIAIVDILLLKKKLRAGRLVIVSFLLWFALSLSQLSILNYIFYQPGITTRSNLTMSLPTTLGLIYVVCLYASFILTHVWRLYHFAFSRWLIVSFIFIGLTGGYATWKSAKILENAYLQYMTKGISLVIKNAVIEYSRDKLNILQNVLFFLQNPNETNKEYWHREVSIYMEQNPELALIVGYVPSEDTFWQVNPSDSPHAVQKLLDELVKHPTADFIVLTQPLSPAFIVTNRTDDPSKPWMAILIDIHKLVTKLSPKELENSIGMSITWEGNILFFKQAQDQKYRSLYRAVSEIPLLDPPILLEVWPTTTQYHFLKTPLPNLVLVFNLSALCLALIVFYYAELARKRGEEFRKAEEEKTAFFANISHEIRTQLQGIMGTGSVLEMTPLSEKQQKMINIIKASGNVLQRLLNDLLDLTKFEMGQMMLDPRPASVSHSIKEVINLMAPKAEMKGIKLEAKIDPNLPHIMFLDNHRFEQIISNLLSNAIKFTSDGSVTISATTNIMDEFDKAMLIVTVTDTGIGIPAHAMPRIFDKFYQVHSHTNHSIEGTGLGLPISRMLAEYMGGSLTCESVEGKGSTFKLMIPVRYEEKQENKI